MSTIVLEVAGKSKTGKGIVGKDKVWFNTGKGVSFADVNKGDVVELEYNGATGVNFVSKVIKQETRASLPPVPSLPKTTITETKAPGGESPVKPASKKSETETMTKNDWANKDRNIEVVAVIKSVLESPAYAQLVVGKRETEAIEIGHRLVDSFLGKLASLRV